MVRLRVVDARLLVDRLAYLYVLLRTQKWLPFNPQHFDNMAPDLAWNTAVSFPTNTNWQFYSGESTMSYLSQMAGLAWHNFVSAAAGIAVAVAVVRGVVRTNVKTLGNFWVDLTRCSLYVLLPISHRRRSCSSSGKGMPQNFHAYQTVKSIEGFTQSITGGPMASQEVIKELGTNGGGFVNANSASPNENPTPLTNLVELLLDLFDRRRLDVHVRQDGEGHAPGLGDLRRDGDPLLRRLSPSHIGPKPPAIRSCSSLASRGGKHGGQGVPLRRSRPRRCSRRSRPIRRAARSTRCTIRSCRSAALFRWSTCSSARSSSAASAAACTA